MTITDQHYDLSVIIPADHEPESLADLLSKIHTVLDAMPIAYETIVAEHQADAQTRRVIDEHHALFLDPEEAGYGASLLSGLHHAQGEYVVVIDTDQTDFADFLKTLWQARETGDVIIASRYVLGGQAVMPIFRVFISKILNTVFGRGLDLRVKDMSSAFRLYKTRIVKSIVAESKGYDILQEILVKILMGGYQITEIPLVYRPRSNHAALARTARFGAAYLKTFSRLWKLRNSIASADYDARAYDALMPPQRYWQRQRYKHITEMHKGQGKCLDVGCGSSKIMETLPPGSVVIDILLRKLRFSRKYGQFNVQGSIFELPISDQSFPCVICSQVIEHVPRANVLDELDRTLQPGGYLILGTPDYAKWQWRTIEALYKIILPQAYADEHITHYTYDELIGEYVTKRGYKLEAVKYILQGELILGLRKPKAAPTLPPPY